MLCAALKTSVLAAGHMYVVFVFLFTVSAVLVE